MSKSKNKALLAVFVLLVVAYGASLGLKPGSNKLAFEPGAFAVQDTAAIAQITLNVPANGGQPARQNTLARQGNQWVLNNRYAVDVNIIRVLLSVLQQVQVQRPVAAAQAAQVNQLLATSGVQVQLNNAQGQVLGAFTAGGNNLKTRSYFKAQGGGGNAPAYVVNLPGYNSFVAGIFTIPENDWRQRRVFPADPRQLTSFAVSYGAKGPAGSFAMQGMSWQYRLNNSAVQQPDTAGVFNWVDQASIFEVYQYVQPGSMPRLDSLKQAAQPLATLQWAGVLKVDTATLQVLPALPKPGYNPALQPGLLNGQELVLLDGRSLEGLLVNPNALAQAPN